MSVNGERVVERILDMYQKKTPKCKAHNEKARRYLPGGDTRASTYFLPYPLYIGEGKGCFLYDADGNEYLDMLGNYSSLIHGHAHPDIVAAIKAQAGKGTVFGSASEIQYLHAQHLCQRISSFDLVRYCNSGTEATLFSIRAARGFTHKDAIIKMDGGYHGGHDLAEVNIVPDLESKGRPRASVRAGVPATVMQDVFVVPFNDLTAMEDILKAEAHRIAAIILEPLPGVGGAFPLQPGYLAGVRDLANRYGVLLIFDEVISFRLSYGGLQQLVGVAPDLTALGKIIGGGLPVGGFGGRADIMSQFDPALPKFIWHSGTFSGTNLVMAAGLASLKALTQSAIDRINALGEQLREGFSEAFRGLGIRGQVTGIGSIAQVHWDDSRIENARDCARIARAAGRLPALLHMEMINRGFYSANRGVYFISTPMTKREIKRAIEAFEGTLGVLKPYVAEETPHLLIT
jgi:glutamate-1-semialdehyde 2,1-aminomutase